MSIITALLGIWSVSDTASPSPEAVRQPVSAEVRTQDDVLRDTARDRILARWKSRQRDKWHALRSKSFVANVSAYTAAADECGKSDGITASGVTVMERRTLACPPEYPFGAQIEIEGVGTFVCEDRGGAIKGNRFDIYVKTKAEAFAFGRRYLAVRVIP